MLHRLILLQVVLDTAVPFILESQSPVINITLVFIVASTSRAKGLRSGVICELLEHESTSEFSDFTELKTVMFAKKMMMQIQCMHHSSGTALK